MTGRRLILEWRWSLPHIVRGSDPFPWGNYSHWCNTLDGAHAEAHCPACGRRYWKVMNATRCGICEAQEICRGEGA